jgi:FixJ family two-component response regulator
VRDYRRPSQGCLIHDQHLPPTSGLDFLASHAGRGLGIPVILITGQGNSIIARRARQAGLEYLEKPIGPERLIKTVERAIEWRRESRVSADIHDENLKNTGRAGRFAPGGRGTSARIAGRKGLRACPGELRALSCDWRFR